MDGHSNWPEARAQCQRVGGFLAEFESFEEHIHVTNMIGFCRWLYFHVLGYIEGSLTFFAVEEVQGVHRAEWGLPIPQPEVVYL